MTPPRLHFRHYVVLEVNGKRETVVSRHATRFEASRAKKAIEGTTSGRLYVKARWS